VNKQGNVLARVNDEYLYDSQLKGLVPGGTSPADSIALVKNFVRNWVKTTLMIHQAENNLSSHQLNFDNQLNDYKNSLIIFKYESEWIRQNLDTIVPDAEIESYYEQHASNFELKENIAKLMYIVLDKDSGFEGKFDKALKLPDSLMLDRIENLCKEFANSFYLDTATWVRFNWIEENLPVEIYNPEQYLNKNSFVKVTEGDDLYLIKFIDYKIKDDVSPIDFEYNHIRNIIINKRKMYLAKKLRDDIYENAILNNEFEIYYNE
jgi:hypothetical protein